MAETFNFRLITPTGVLFDGAVEQVTAIGPLGEFGVLPMHTNFITSIAPGVITLKLGEGNFNEFLLASGLAEVKDGAMTALAVEAEAPGAVDSAGAAAQATAAEQRLAMMSMFDPEYEEAAHALALARARAQIEQLRRAPR
jgi:F-type H+-transporting ATPase subunit epsilon